MRDSKALALGIEALCERAAGAMRLNDWEALCRAEDTKEALWQINEAMDTIDGQKEDLHAAKILCVMLAGIEEVG